MTKRSIYWIAICGGTSKLRDLLCNSMFTLDGVKELEAWHEVQSHFSHESLSSPRGVRICKVQPKEKSFVQALKKKHLFIRFDAIVLMVSAEDNGVEVAKMFMEDIKSAESKIPMLIFHDIDSSKCSQEVKESLKTLTSDGEGIIMCIRVPNHQINDDSKTVIRDAIAGLLVTKASYTVTSSPEEKGADGL